MKRIKDYCDICLKKRSIQKNKKCRACNRQQGLKECSRCRTICLISLDFYNNGEGGTCKHCLGYKGTNGGRHPKMQQEDRNEIWSMTKKGSSNIKIAAIFGCTTAMVSKVIREFVRKEGQFSCRRCLKMASANEYCRALCLECQTHSRRAKKICT